MQCSSSINLHFASSSSTLYLHSSLNLNTKSCSFQPSLKVTPSPSPTPQQQHKKTHRQEGRTSQYSTHHHLQASDADGKPKLITSVSNPFVKHCLKLRNSSSYRRSHGSVLVVGATPTREIYRFQESLQDESIRMDCLILPDKAEIPNGLDKSTSSIVYASSIVMRKISGLQSIDSIDAIAVMKIPASFCDVDGDQKKADCKKWFPSAHRILVLDGIQDPGNLGTLLRSAVAFQWDGVFLLPGCCDPFNEKALRASRGASFQLPIVSK